MLTYDSRVISALVFQKLSQLKELTNNPSDQKEQKSQAVELYSYTATWGLLRLKAEEFALSSPSQRNKRDTIICFFSTLGKLVSPDEPDVFSGENGLRYLSDRQRLGASQYLGLTGIALQVAREFAFWAEAVYPK